MSRRSPSEYEKFLAELVNNLKARHAVECVGWGQKNRLRGRSGVRHQVDVSFIDKDGPEPKLVLIECKSFRSGKAVNLGQVKVLKATLDDLKGDPSHPSIVVAHMISSVPLQSGAHAYASHYDILSQLVSDGPSWVFRYGQMLQLGLEIQAEAATIHGKASKHRHCEACHTIFAPTGSEVHCQNCNKPGQTTVLITSTPLNKNH